MENQWSLFDIIKTLPGIAFGVFIIILSSISIPKSIEPPIIELFDINYVLHIFEFAVFGFLIFFGFSQKVKNKYIIIFLCFFALSDEIHQYLVPNRYFDIMDFFFDLLGGLLGYLFYSILLILKDRYENN